MWNRLRQGRFSGDARQSRMEGEGMVQRKDLANIQRWEKGIEAALALRLKYDFGQVLKRAFEEWREIPALTRQSEAADIVLSAFYQQGKISDYLEKLEAFADRIPSMSSQETVRNQGYYNYLFFLRQFVEDMKPKYEAAREAAEKAEPAETAPANVLRFISSECASVAALKDLPKAREAVRRLKDSLVLGKARTSLNIQDLAFVSESMEFLEMAVRSGDTRELEDAEENLMQRKRALKENIDKGSGLYDIITAEMTEEWFEAFNPESDRCLVMDMPKEKIRQLYIEKISRIRKKTNGL